MNPQILLASASPRRRELLAQIGIRHHVCPVDIDETPWPDEDPLAYVERMAATKAAEGALRFGDVLPVLAADTTVVLNGQIFGKPLGQNDALNMLAALSGQTHQVYTAIALQGQGFHRAISRTDVTFRELSAEERLAYWQTGEPKDKAGAYAIQGQAAVFVSALSGSFSGVVGLPLYETAQLLAREGIAVW